MSLNLPTHAGNSSFVADLIIVNGNIHTMDATQPGAQAVAIHGNRIIAVGSNEEIKKLPQKYSELWDVFKTIKNSQAETM